MMVVNSTTVLVMVHCSKSTQAMGSPEAHQLHSRCANDGTARGPAAWPAKALGCQTQSSTLRAIKHQKHATVAQPEAVSLVIHSELVDEQWDASALAWHIPNVSALPTVHTVNLHLHVQAFPLQHVVLLCWQLGAAGLVG